MLFRSRDSHYRLPIHFTLTNAGCPDNPDEFYNQAVKYFQENKIEDAIRSFKETIKLAPFDIDALYNLATIYIKTNNYKDACHYLNRIKDTGKPDADLLLNKYCK